jgi:hypothetical protein
MRKVFSILFIAAFAGAAGAVDLIALQESNWDEYVPKGKEVDAIYGDFVLRNDNIVAVIAYPSRDRSANMMTKSSGGAIIDLTLRDHQSDQIQGFFSGGGRFTYAFDGVEVDGESVEIQDIAHISLTGKSIAFKLFSPGRGSRFQQHLRYTLKDGTDHIEVTSVFKNTSDSAKSLTMRDTWRHDNSKDGSAIQRSKNGRTQVAWTYDKWFDQAYGLTTPNGMALTTRAKEGWNAPQEVIYLVDEAESIELSGGESYTLTRAFFPARNMLAVQAMHASIQGKPWEAATLTVVDPNGDAIANADIDVFAGVELIGYGTTDNNGTIELYRSSESLTGIVSALGHGKTAFPMHGGLGIHQKYNTTLSSPAWVDVHVSAEGGGPIPCKVQFFGTGDTPDPFFGPDSGIAAVRNVYYSHNGSFRQKLDPGSYEVIVSYGPEYDAEVFEINAAYGTTATLEATLRRVVETPGWVSTDFHSHSSPSGDNASSQRGRVLNLLAEHIEFAPCTEHNRIDTYATHLEALNAADLLATCSGMELTSSPGSLNHHNVFPLEHKPRTQDGGGPRTSPSPEQQIERIALWDDDSEKLVQQNHPSIAWMFFDRDKDGVADAGYDKMHGLMDVIEVRPPSGIFDAPFSADGEGGALADKPKNRMFEWVQTLNQGHRVPGVGNADSHANFHGSGWTRNYVKSQSDDPARIDTMDMVKASQRGNIIMTNGPYLEVDLRAGDNTASAGDDLAASDGKSELDIRVQSPNWFDVDRVQVFVNGRPDPSLNFTRASHPDFFENGTVNFNHTIPIELKTDAHIIVGVIGENSELGPVVGPRRSGDRPVAVANPIFVDVDGGGFKANGDDLGYPLPPKPDN